MKNIEKIMSRNIPEIMEKISCFLCKKQDKLFIKNGYEERYGFSQMVILLRRATRPYLAIC